MTDFTTFKFAQSNTNQGEYVDEDILAERKKREESVRKAARKAAILQKRKKRAAEKIAVRNEENARKETKKTDTKYDSKQNNDNKPAQVKYPPRSTQQERDSKEKPKISTANTENPQETVKQDESKSKSPVKVEQEHKEPDRQSTGPPIANRRRVIQIKEPLETIAESRERLESTSNSLHGESSSKKSSQRPSTPPQDTKPQSDKPPTSQEQEASNSPALTTENQNAPGNTPQDKSEEQPRHRAPRRRPPPPKGRHGRGRRLPTSQLRRGSIPGKPHPRPAPGRRRPPPASAPAPPEKEKEDIPNKPSDITSQEQPQTKTPHTNEREQVETPPSQNITPPPVLPPPRRQRFGATGLSFRSVFGKRKTEPEQIPPPNNAKVLPPIQKKDEVKEEVKTPEKDLEPTDEVKAQEKVINDTTAVEVEEHDQTNEIIDAARSISTATGGTPEVNVAKARPSKEKREMGVQTTNDELESKSADEKSESGDAIKDNERSDSKSKHSVKTASLSREEDGTKDLGIETSSNDSPGIGKSVTSIDDNNSQYSQSSHGSGFEKTKNDVSDDNVSTYSSRNINHADDNIDRDQKSTESVSDTVSVDAKTPSRETSSPDNLPVPPNQSSFISKSAPVSRPVSLDSAHQARIERDTTIVPNHYGTLSRQQNIQEFKEKLQQDIGLREVLNGRILLPLETENAGQRPDSCPPGDITDIIRGEVSKARLRPEKFKSFKKDDDFYRDVKAKWKKQKERRKLEKERQETEQEFYFEKLLNLIETGHDDSEEELDYKPTYQVKVDVEMEELHNGNIDDFSPAADERNLRQLLRKLETDNDDLKRKIKRQEQQFPFSDKKLHEIVDQVEHEQAEKLLKERQEKWYDETVEPLTHREKKLLERKEKKEQRKYNLRKYVQGFAINIGLDTPDIDSPTPSTPGLGQVKSVDKIERKEKEFALKKNATHRLQDAKSQLKDAESQMWNAIQTDFKY